jgi:long-chain acyl-CoA synthetase
MTKDIRLTFPAMFQETVKNFGERNALAFVGEKALNFKEANTRVLNLIAFFEQLGLKSDDKVAILSANMPNWGIAYFATTFMQAVAIPILPDFSANEIENILNHSEAKVVLVSGKLQGKVAGVNCPGLKHILNIEDFSIISSTDKTSSFNESSFPQHNYNVEEDDLATIIYTSGTTGKSKGVMLSHKNITANAIAAGKVQPVDEDDRFLSILPLSHVYENTLGLILPMIYGASVYYLHEKPVPSVLLPALKTVKPTLILSVPLIIEKIYRNKVKPALTTKPVLRFLMKAPFIRKKLHAAAGKKLKVTFGGELKFFGVGGAKLDREVEKFLIEAKFPYAIGYGLTESAPIIAGLNPQHQRLQSTGPAVEGVELRLDEKDPVTGVGEILAKGPNIMMGYYKEPEETKKVITEDGWLRTGDLGAFDEENYLFIKGRSKNVIIGANGENIYPEEIESVINNFRHVLESVVLERKGKLVALVHFNVEELEKNLHELHDEVSNYIEQRLKELEDELLQYVNLRVNKFSHLKLVVVHENPFQKTPTLKIKRFLYQ